MSESPYRICILGAGAVGSLIGGQMRAGGLDVSMVGRPAHIEAIRSNGLRMTSVSIVWHEGLASGFTDLATSIAECSTAPFDLIVIATRTTETAEATRLALPALAPDGLLLSIQNGLGNWEAMAEIVGWERVVGGILNTGVELAAPGHVNVTVQGFPVMIGRPPHPDAPAQSRIEDLVARLEAAEVPVENPPDIRARQWRKLMYNCALNAPATVRDGKYSVLLGDPEARADQEAIIAECYAVAEALRIPLDPPTLAEFQQWFFEGVFPATADHIPSMLVHFRAGKMPEIDAMNGAIARLGEKAGVPTPVNARYTKLVREKAAQIIV
ncbi:ketopantoate reductase family protein [bacterium]|nr:ketopantoate reductase family protein [bacterium]